MDALELKSALLCYGIETKGIPIKGGRHCGAGPAGICYEVGGFLVNTPINKVANESSPFKLASNGRLESSYTGETIPINAISKPKYYDKLTSCDTHMRKIALLHGKDCLATTLYQKCVFMERELGCGFCAINTSLEKGETILKKSPQQLGEVVSEAVKDGITHITITTGTPNLKDHGATMLIEVVKHLKGLFDLPIHVQLTPPQPKYLDQLYKAGVDTLGIHVETFDENVMRHVCVGKSGLDYTNALRYAISLFGNGQVSSFVIGGLGEDPATMVAGFEELTSSGIIPFLVPFRPLHGARFEDRPPPDHIYMKELYIQLADTLKKYGMNLGKHSAGCVRCGACSAIDVAMK